MARSRSWIRSLLLAAVTASCGIGDHHSFQSEPVTGSCGKERWAIKTGTDEGAAAVDLSSPKPTTIPALQQLQPQAGASSSQRLPGVEDSAWVLRDVTLVKFKLERDSDVHLAISDTAGDTMIAEIPDPACVGPSSPWGDRIASARDALTSAFSAPSGRWAPVGQPISIMGVGFMDNPHGQSDEAPNGVEIHPVLSFCAGAGCQLPGVDDRPLASGSSSSSSGMNQPPPTGSGGSIQTVWLIVMENHNWADIAQTTSAPFLTGTMLSAGAHAENYQNPPGNHPSEPNYLWLEAGSNLGVSDDGTPARNEQATTDHLVSYLESAGISWKSYQEGIDGTICPLKNAGLYAPKHNPMVFFDDVTDSLSSGSAHCIAHVRPLEELATDLGSGDVARYNFITPDLCNDMHGAKACAGTDLVAAGDAWLSQWIGRIQASSAYQSGAILVTWDESEGGDVPIGMIALSPFAKQGYASTVPMTHSSTLRTLQEIFAVTPLLGDAQNANDLGDLFVHL